MNRLAEELSDTEVLNSKGSKPMSFCLDHPCIEYPSILNHQSPTVSTITNGSLHNQLVMETDHHFWTTKAAESEYALSKIQHESDLLELATNISDDYRIYMFGVLATLLRASSIVNFTLISCGRHKQRWL